MTISTIDWFYSWKDIENVFHRLPLQQWHEKWVDINVYNDAVVIEVDSSFRKEDEFQSKAKLSDIFKERYHPERNCLVIDYFSKELEIVFEETMLGRRTKKTIPLFKEFLSSAPTPPPLEGVPVFSFHSYKGGVGRTLSLISAIRSLSLQKDRNRPLRLLVVDSDLEAPGLTWLAKQKGGVPEISLLDALSIIHEEEDWRNEPLEFISQKIQEVVLRLPIGEQEVEHYFLPAFRKDEQVAEPPIRPEQLVYASNREWIIGDFYSELGKKLNVDAVLVDLRAGISEFSAPLLFDPRIQKVFVTSTSLQSVEGTKTILKYIYPKPVSEEYPKPVIFVSMVPAEILDSEKHLKIQEELSEAYPEQEEDPLTPNLSIQFLPFASSLVHIEGFDLIDRKLAGTEMASIINKITENWITTHQEELSPSFERERDDFLQKLKEKASSMEFAENSLFSSFLKTTSLKNIAKKYKRTVPVSVIMGAKGSGKTFAYLQFLRLKTWERFVEEVEGEVLESNSIIVPFLKPKNIENEAIEKMAAHFNYISSEIGFKVDLLKMQERFDEIQLKESELTTEAHWKAYWKELLLNSTGLDFNSLDELNLYLEKKEKRIIFTVDGLEELFQNTVTSAHQKMAVQALCQSLINDLRYRQDNRIGLLVFLRRDVGMNSIQQNWGQFYSLYSSFELKWTNTEALRLVSWVSGSIDSSLITHDLPIEEATRELLEKKLQPLWGLKMGKPTANEAYSANWILAALSDLNEQLQPRDIVRFLKHAASGSIHSKFDYTDRYLSPSAIRNAILPCSEKKIEEISQEMSYMEAIFEKLKTANNEKKQIPFQIEDIHLKKEEISVMEQQGYLLKLNDGYYMPEIIRRGLGFNLAKGARPKVLALLKRKN